MLPKFASHVLHHTQRAAATAQNYAIRNVLGLQNQSSTTPNSLTSWSNAASGSSSGWGSAGGAKSSTGSWFYQGYNVSFFFSSHEAKKIMRILKIICLMNRVLDVP